LTSSLSPNAHAPGISVCALHYGHRCCDGAEKAGGHYRFSTEVGAAIGRKIGELAVQNYMILLAND